MRIVLFCEQKYAINILTPIQEESTEKRRTRYFMVCPFPEYP